jgi:hypothetical protein
LSRKVVTIVGIRSVTVGFFDQTTEIIVVVIDDEFINIIGEFVETTKTIVTVIGSSNIRAVFGD